MAVDPIEKKPLAMFRPGSRLLSTGPPGCNLSCSHCQNWQSSQGSPPTVYHSPDELAALAVKSSDGIAFTYTEPVVWYEYVMDTAPLVRSLGGIVVMVSNGFVNPEPLERLLAVTDAWNVDLKAWSDDFYRRNCGGDLQPVLATLRAIARSDIHLEVTYLVIPGENDSEADWDSAALWLADNCGENTPVHVSRYFPRYRQTRPATPVECVFRAAGVFSTRLKNVFPGNV
jgi:pyruvate formate lyase activating enzyme